jgi:mono/diheme cytochrome c family protein
MRTAIRTLAVVLGLVSSACDSDDEPVNPRVDDVLALTGDSTAGMMVFVQVCGTTACHGPDGNTPGTPQTVKFSERIPEMDDRGIADTILSGLRTMPAQSQLTDQQVADVVAYVLDTFH